MNWPVLTKRVSSTAILSLHIYRNYLLIGESSNLTIYNIEETLYVATQKMFSTAQIHGIKECSNGPNEIDPKFLIWGQKSFILVSLNLKELNWKLDSEEFQIDDWIIDAIWSEDGLSVIVITAHNSLICYISEKSQNVKQSIPNSESLSFGYYENLVLEKKNCSENSLLYSGQITGVSWTSCVVLSGTVFGNIHIWAPWTKSDEFGRNSPIVSITGPKGAVFSVRYDDDKKLIAATSDDRSVRVWKVIFIHEDNCTNLCTCIDVQTQSAWLSCHIEQIYCSFGHTARVWRSLILKDKTVFSCGEDSTICHWSSTGSLLDSWIAHPSSDVWCLTYYKDTLFSGGGDGAVKRWKMVSQNQGNLIVLPLPWNNINSSENMKKEAFQKELACNSFPRTVCLVSPNMLLTVFDNGFVWVCHSENSQWIWKFVFQHPFLKCYSVSSVSHDSSLLALGTLTGHVIILEIGMWKCIYELQLSSTKIQSVLFINQNQLVTCTEFGKIQLLTMQLQGIAGDMISMLRKLEHKLPPCRHPWITAASAILQENCGNVDLVAGDPCGNLHLFSPNSVSPKSSLKKLHGRSAVTSVKSYQNILLTTGRDGHVCYLVVKDGQIELLQNLKLSYGTWLCGIIKMGPNLIVPSFNSDKLKIWNISGEELMTEIVCGGGHRSWDMFIGTQRLTCSGVLEDNFEVNNKLLTCAFLRDGTPVIWKTLLSRTSTPIKSPICGREIQCLEPLFFGEEGIFLAFGGEDTFLHIHLLQRGKLSKITKIKSHLSSIRSLTRIVPLHGKNLVGNDVYILSSGGRAQCKVWKVTLTYKGMNMICNAISVGEYNPYNLSFDLLDEYIYCKEINSHMFSPESNSTCKISCPASHPETRYMDSLAFWITVNQALFILASSDGFVRFFIYSAETKFFLLHNQDCQSCVFRLCIIMLKDYVYLVASTSKGNIIIWNLKDIITSVETFCMDNHFKICCTSLFETLQYQVQNAGLNSIAPSEEVADEQLFFVTGGEDGSIHLVRFSNMVKEKYLRHPIKVDICSKVCLHASKVSGLTWLDKTHLCSASADQRLIIWRIENHNLIPLSVHFSSLPDIQGLKFLSSEFFTGNVPEESDTNKLIPKLLVYGAGIEVFDVSETVKDFH